MEKEIGMKMLMVSESDLKAAFKEWATECEQARQEAVREDTFLTLEQVAKMLPASRTKLWHLERKGILHKIKRGARVFYRESEIRDYMCGKIRNNM